MTEASPRTCDRCGEPVGYVLCDPCGDATQTAAGAQGQVSAAWVPGSSPGHLPRPRLDFDELVEQLPHWRRPDTALGLRLAAELVDELIDIGPDRVEVIRTALEDAATAVYGDTTDVWELFSHCEVPS